MIRGDFIDYLVAEMLFKFVQEIALVPNDFSLRVDLVVILKVFDSSADHGFIYQHRMLDEGDSIDSEPEGEQVIYRGLRFIIGKKLFERAGLRKFVAIEFDI